MAENQTLTHSKAIVWPGMSYEADTLECLRPIHSGVAMEADGAVAAGSVKTAVPIHPGQELAGSGMAAANENINGNETTAISATAVVWNKGQILSVPVQWRE